MSGLSLPVIPLMVTGSLCLVFTFVIFFLADHMHRARNAERDSLLPLADETPRVANSRTHFQVQDHSHDHDEHAGQVGGNCGCRTGRHAPCPGCLKQPVSKSR